MQKKSLLLVLIHVNKRQQKLEHVIEMSSTVTKDLLLDNCPQLSQIAWFCIEILTFEVCSDIQI